MPIYTYPGGGGSPADAKWIHRWSGGTPGVYFGNAESVIAAYGEMVMFDCRKAGSVDTAQVIVTLPLITAADYGKEVAVNSAFGRASPQYGIGYMPANYANSGYDATKGAGRIRVRPFDDYQPVGWDQSPYTFGIGYLQITLGHNNRPLYGRISEPSFVGIFTAGPPRNGDPGWVTGRYSYRIDGGAVPRGDDSSGAAG